MSLIWVPFEPAPTCGAQPSKRSAARCEMPADHKGVKIAADWHCGRTRGGYWKTWKVAPQ
jgi:predicted carbohydrate-binding protein with CBM5 and CBM33 domain